MKRETQRKGDIGVTQAIATFTRQGFDVALPVTESAAYDLIVDDGNLHKVQVKYIGGSEVDLRCIHSNGKGYVVKKYGKDFDWLYVLKADGREYLIKEDLSGRRSINPSESTRL